MRGRWKLPLFESSSALANDDPALYYQRLGVLKEWGFFLESEKRKIQKNQGKLTALVL